MFFLWRDVVPIDMGADGNPTHPILLFYLFGSVPFGQIIICLVFGKSSINMLFAVIVELTDTDFWDIVFSCICPNPFLRYFVLFGNLLGSVVLSYIKVIFNSSSFIGARFKHQFNVGSANNWHPCTDSWCSQFILLDELIDVLTRNAHQLCCLCESKVILMV